MSNSQPIAIIGVRRTLPITQEQAWAYIISSEGLSSWLGDLPLLHNGGLFFEAVKLFLKRN
ncbi:hypothetical protein ACFPYJ_30635 [Paenibacillus solisilvae]|uniref:ATPase n=1 Tax=Paenibacillus solisilvae TaxID=2486751 RepID=A0ABW0W5A1_9BACL